ncbi:MAG: InlB B-repeat-containing protein [Treponema sp.]|nr:InlB B-repeat-containing protein [Candidatus Treponema equifaecale]
MKKKLRYLLTCILFIVSIVACKSDYSPEEKYSATISLSLYSSARTVLPEVELSEMTDFVLKGKKANESEKILSTFSAAAEVNSSKLQIDVGDWIFSLTAKLGDSVFYSVISKSVVTGDNILSFNLKLSGIGKGTGSINVSLTFPENAEITCIKAGLFDVETDSEIIEFECENLTFADSKVTYLKSVVPAGSYWLKFIFYGKDDLYLNTYKELVTVSSDLESCAERKIESLNEVYSIQFVTNGGEFSIETIPGSYTRYSDFEIPEDIIRPNYTFLGWYTTPDFSGEKTSSIAIGTTGNLELYAKWSANTNTKYSVKHWWQNISDDGYTLHETDEKTGTTDTETNAIEKSYVGFTSKSFVQKNISGYGTTEVNIYYDRNIISLSINLDGGSSLTSVVNGKLNGRYGAPVDFSTPYRMNYKFIGWNAAGGTLPAKFTESAAYTALWSKSALSVSLNQLSDISMSYNQSGSVITFTADSGYSSYSWELDGSSLSSSSKSVSIDTANFRKGTYEVYLLAEKNGDYRSATAFIKVE